MVSVEQNEWNAVEKVILERRSVRLYKDKQVPEELVKRILEAGRFAPSAGNCQPWKFIVLRDKEIIDSLANAVVMICQNMKAMFSQVKPPEPLNPVPYSAVFGIAEGKLGVFHDAPTVILMFKDVRGVSNPDFDCGIAGQNMVLTAHSLGLGTCYVGFAGLAFQLPEWKERFGIDVPYEFICSIAIGYPKGKPDGMVERETHAVEWYENAAKTVIY